MVLTGRRYFQEAQETTERGRGEAGGQNSKHNRPCLTEGVSAPPDSTQGASVVSHERASLLESSLGTTLDSSIFLPRERRRRPVGAPRSPMSASPQ